MKYIDFMINVPEIWLYFEETTAMIGNFWPVEHSDSEERRVRHADVQ